MLQQDKREKAIFTETLLPILKAIDSSIVAAEYHSSDEREWEAVVIEYSNGHQKHANVTGDSLKALAIDVLETL